MGYPQCRMYPRLSILYEDDDLLAVDKPSGLASIPERYDNGGPSVLALLKEKNPRILAVHRIDKETSGVLLFAKSPESQRSLSLQFENHSLFKTYHALAGGRPEWEEMDCGEPLLPDADRGHRTLVKKEGKPSKTRFRVLSRFRTCFLVEAIPETGRTHQIRVHLSHLGHPVLCDPLYGDGAPLFLSSFKRGFRGVEERPLLSRLALHAASVEIEHPGTKLPFKIDAPYPKDMASAVKQLQKNS